MRFTTSLLPLAVLLTLLAAPGCGGDDESDPSASDGGADDDGAVVGGCDDGCESGQRCVDEVCTSVEQLYVAVGETAFLAPRPATQRAQVVSYAPLRDAPVDQRPVLAESGDCTLYGAGDYLATHEATCSDWGTITVTGVPALEYACADGVSNVFEEGEDLLAAGSQLTVSGSGGADFPAFSAEVELPPSVSGTIPAVEQGATIEASWEPAGASVVNVSLSVSDEAGDVLSVLCRTDDSGSVVIDSTITAQFPASIATWFASITRWEDLHLEPEDAEVAIDVGSYADLRLYSM